MMASVLEAPDLHLSGTSPEREEGRLLSARFCPHRRLQAPLKTSFRYGVGDKTRKMMTGSECKENKTATFGNIQKWRVIDDRGIGCLPLSTLDWGANRQFLPRPVLAVDHSKSASTRC
jgi:hypothetical protein